MQHPVPRPGARRLLLCALAVQAAWGTAFIATSRLSVDGVSYFSLFDDAMISMRYARNLAGGSGLVWNAGYAPVEGYSNLLWTLWMATLHLAAAERVVSLLVMLSGLAILLANIVVIWAIARTVEPERPVVAGLSAILVACCYSLGYWTLRGMEVGLLVLVLDAAVLAVVSEESGTRWSRPVLLVALAVLPLIRADGIVPAAVLAIYAASTDRERRLTRWIVPAVPIAVFAVHALLRHQYYGEWLPNTYYLKVEGVSLVTRAVRGVPALALTGAWALWPAGGLLLLGRPLERRRRVLTLVAAVMCAYSAYVGGDAWEWTGHINRYIVCGLPLAFVLAAAGAERLATAASLGEGWVRWVAAPVVLGAGAHWIAATRFFPEPELSVGRPALLGTLVAGCLAVIALTRLGARPWVRPASLGIASGVLVLTLSGAKTLEWLRFNDLHVTDDAFLAEMGIRFQSITAPDARIAVVTAGAIPYFSHRVAVDLLGKSDSHIAHLPSHAPFVPGHSKWDYRYTVATWRPDVIVQLWRPTADEVAYLAEQHYRANGAGILVRSDSLKIDADAVLRMTLDVERRRAAARQHSMGQ